MARGGFGTKQFNGRVHTWVGYKKFKYPCGGFTPGPTTNLKAGQLIPVRFWTGGMNKVNTMPKKKIRKTSRHGGGMCEFSLSNDGGKSFHANACSLGAGPLPLLNSSTRSSCADVTIEGATNGTLPKQMVSCKMSVTT
ncbi:hypothetical protein BGW39_005711 [Mortierella sp. 14UC]|nr:hypothetical protein BGW39_005711 [Mortierella sp. 14UC]